MSKKFKGVLTRRVLRHRQAVAPRHLDSHQERKIKHPTVPATPLWQDKVQWSPE